MRLGLKPGELVEWEGADCVLMIGLQAVNGGPETRFVVAATLITNRAVYHYPGDVVYPRSAWRIAGHGPTVGIAEYAAAEQAAWEAGPGRRFRPAS